IKQEEKLEAAELRAAKGLPPKPTKASLLDDVPSTLPAMNSALKLQKKASKVGFDWNNPECVLDKIREEIDELSEEIKSSNQVEISGELGDLLFAIVNLARHLDVDPEIALRTTNVKFRNRFAHVEKRLKDAGTSLDEANLTEMEALWIEAKNNPDR
ncbi:MAG: MazG family protein, partial [Pseudomonadota bacterium]